MLREICGIWLCRNWRRVEEIVSLHAHTLHKQPVTFQVMPPSLSVGDTEELKRKSAHQLMQLSQLLMARDRELEELNEMVSLLKSQLGISGAEDAKEVLKAIEAHVRATEGKLQQAVRETEVLKQGEEAAEQSVAEAMAAVEKVVATAEAAAAKAIAAAEKRATDAAADAADAVAAAEEGAAKAIAAAEVWADEEIQEAKEKAEELVRQAQAEAAARRGDLEKVQSIAQCAQEQQNKFLKQSAEREKHAQERVRQEQERVAQMERRAEVWRDAEKDAMALAATHAGGHPAAGGDASDQAGRGQGGVHAQGAGDPRGDRRAEESD